MKKRKRSEQGKKEHQKQQTSQTDMHARKRSNRNDQGE